MMEIKDHFEMQQKRKWKPWEKKLKNLTHDTMLGKQRKRNESIYKMCKVFCYK